MVALANIVVGPIIFALILGFIIGSRINMDVENSFKFTLSGIIALILLAFLMSRAMGQLPFYGDLPISTSFLGALIGIFIGSAVLGGRAKGDH